MAPIKDLPIRIWDALRSSLWFVPSLIVSAMIVLAIILIDFKGTIDDDIITRFPRLFGAGAEGSRGLLTAVASSMITVAGVIFSITIVVLSLASNQYSPRILRNFMRDRYNQAVLGTFLGIFAYCLIVVRTIRSGDDPYVPSLAVLVSVVLALVAVGVLIGFIHHIIASIQAGRIIAEAASETLGAIDHIFPEPMGEPLSESEQEAAKLVRFFGETSWLQVPSLQSGYVSRVDGDALVDIAEKYGAVLRMDYAPGDFCVEGMPIISLAAVNKNYRSMSESENRQAIFEKIDKDVIGDEAKLGRIADEVNSRYQMGRNRTVGQDVGFGIQQIVDIALKALSPGVNESTTAINCLHSLTLINSRLAARQIESRRRAKDGDLRVIAQSPTFELLLDLSFNDIRRNASGNVVVLFELIDAMTTVGHFARDNDRRRALRRHVFEIAELADRSVTATSDREVIEPRIRAALHTLGDGDANSWTLSNGAQLSTMSPADQLSEA